MPLSYLDFEIKIEKHENHYKATIVKSPAGEAVNIFTLPYYSDKLGELTLENLLLRLGGAGRGTRKNYTEEMEAARELGGTLFESVFSDKILECFRKSRNGCREETGLRLKLNFSSVPELAELPWEYLFDACSNTFLAQSHRMPVVRYVDMEQIQPLSVKLPLKILAVISSPEGYRQLNTEHEKDLLNQAVSPLVKNGIITIKWLEHATIENIQWELIEEKYHVFHFIGHGGFDSKKRDEGGLILEDGKSNGIWTGAERIGTLLHDQRSLRLAVLNVCEGARISKNDLYSGVATTLIQKGIPAVVAMQFEISDDAAITFAKAFYKGLIYGLPVDAATAEARKAVYFMPNDIEWGTPVLYMRCKDGMLFRIGEDAEIHSDLPADETEDISDETEINLTGRWILTEKYEDGKTTAEVDIIQEGLGLKGHMIITDKPDDEPEFVIKESVAGFINKDKISLSGTDIKIIKGRLKKSEYVLDEWKGKIINNNKIIGSSRDNDDTHGEFNMIRDVKLGITVRRFGDNMPF